MEGFSVIMPVYNQGTFIRRAILSLFAQSYTNWELILVNDGSTDQVEEYIVSVRELYFLKKKSSQFTTCDTVLWDNFVRFSSFSILYRNDSHL